MFVWSVFKELFKNFMWKVLQFVSWITRRYKLKFVFSADVILCGWLGSKHQLTNLKKEKNSPSLNTVILTRGLHFISILLINISSSIIIWKKTHFNVGFFLGCHWNAISQTLHDNNLAKWL